MIEKVKNKDAEPAASKTDDLEEGLEDTFPASDPVSASQPHDGGEQKKDNEEE